MRKGKGMKTTTIQFDGLKVVSGATTMQLGAMAAAVFGAPFPATRRRMERNPKT